MYKIEHIIWVDDSQSTAADKPIDEMGFMDSDTRMRKTYDKVGSMRRQTIWGRHAGLYDGTGYGNESPPITPRSSASTEKTPEMPEQPVFKGQEVRADTLFIEGSAESKLASRVPGAITTSAGDDESLEEVFRTYAVYENQGTRGSTDTDKDSVYSRDKVMENAAVSAVEDLDLSDRMMDVNLGA